MAEIIAWLFESGFTPRGQSYLWDPAVLWMQVAAQVLLSPAFFVMAVMMVPLLRRAKGTPGYGAMQWFTLMVLACGLMHLLNFLTLWVPVYRLTSSVDLIAGLLTMASAFALAPAISKTIAAELPRHAVRTGSSPGAEPADQLSAEEQSRRQTEELEMRVLARTAQVRATIQELKNEIAERKQAEAALQQSEDRFRAMVEASPLGIFLTDQAGDFLYTNRVYQGLSGLTFGAALGGGWSQAVHPDDRDQSFGDWRRAVQLQLPYESVHRFVRKVGNVVWVKVKAVPIQQGQAASGYLGTVDNITESKRSEQALRASEERYRELFENANDFIFTTDPEGTLTSVNKAGELIIGYSRAEAINRMSFGQLVAPEHKTLAQGMLEKSSARRGAATYEMEIVSKDGRRVALEASTRIIRHQGVAVGLQGIARDITERRGLEDQLRQAQKMEAVGRLAGGVAHDFNNLLTAVMGYSDLLLAHIGQSAQLRKYVDEIQKAGDRASSLTGQLLAFSRKHALEPRVVSLNSIVENLDPMLRRLIGEDIHMITAPDPALGHVRADPGQIEQVLMNLVVNARDAMPIGGKLTIETANVELDEDYARRQVDVRPGPHVVLAVSDTGCGMDAETQSHLFEPFYTTKEQGKGTGLGLAIVYGIVKQSGGHICVYSEPGQGSTFKIYLPRVPEDVDVSRARDLVSAPPRGTETVLLVEDQDEVRALAREILEMAGYTVLEARYGPDALSMSKDKQGPIHLMLTDVVMPEMSGWELAERLAVLRPEMKVMFMSGYTDKALAHKGELRPDVPFLQKPFFPAALVRKIREVLDA